jgi:hypothetical protein
MSRQNATNFSGALQFPYANAAADLFKMEDVQVLAQAVDQHDHSSGKGLILPAAAIPDGSITAAKIANGTITSAKIADGTITGTDIANKTIGAAQLADGQIGAQQLADGQITNPKLDGNAVSQIQMVQGFTGNPSTTSGTMVIIPDMAVAINLARAAKLLLVFCGSFVCTVAGSASFQLSIPGQTVSKVLVYSGVGGAIFPVAINHLVTLAAGSYSGQALWSATGGATLQRYGAESQIGVLELSA